MSSLCRYCGLMLALLLAPLPAIAGEVEDVVARAANTWLADWAMQEQWPDAQIEVAVVPHPRPAPRCGQSLKVVPLDTSQLARLRFAARCPDGTSESYVVRASVHSKALAVANATPAGKPIDKSDLQRVDTDLALTPDALLNPDDVVGRASQRPLRAGQVLRERFLKAGAGVRRGEVVQIISRQQMFQITAQGTAMQKGDGDALVRVRNDVSGKLIMARVIGPGVVEPVAGDSVTKASTEH